ncbi:RRP12-like protein [Planococcus citri]|uniref:RRP12-like protein n=1 Tax=Planococcus citri TaxID=170843 RepID=UPI0031F9342C
MGTFRTRIKKKGKRWVKGQSSNSNPSSHKFRNHAKNNFFKEDIEGPTVSTLTVDSLRRHDTLVGSSNQSRVTGEDGRSISENSCADNDAHSSYQSTTKTFDTFASDWTCCSNISFNKLINRFDLSSAHHKEMLAVLAAVTEVIKANGGTENTTEYFAALMTTLEGMKSDELTDSSVSAILSLLSMCIKSVPKNILQLKFATVSKTLMDQLKVYADSDHNVILKALIGCLKVLLCAQDVAVWNDSSTYAIYDAILAFIVHTKSKIRKSAQHAICAILKGSTFMKTDSSLVSHPAAGHTAKHCVKLLESSSSVGGMTTVLHVLTLLKEIIGTFPKAQAKTSCETILKLMTLGNNLVTSCSLQVLHGLFVSRPNVANCPPTLNAQLITALYDYQPPVTDTQPMLAWLAVMQEAFINLAKNDLSLCASNTPKIFDVCAPALCSERKEVITNSTLTMNAILKDCVAPIASEQNQPQYETILKKIFDILTGCLKYQYHNARKQVLFLLGTMYKVCGQTCHEFMIDCLKTLANDRESEEFQYGNEIEQVFAYAIETIGPQTIIKQVPIQICEDKDSFEIKRSWLLPLFKDHIKNSSLKCFVDDFLPIASALKGMNERLNKEKNQAKYVSFELLQSQIWALLPSFCDQPSDIAATFPTIAQPLGKILDSRKDLKQTVLAALRKLVYSCADNEADKQTMSKFAKNYIPILFNIYTTPCKGTDEEAARFSAFETIKVYVSIAESSLLNEMFKKALQKLESEECQKNKFIKESVLDLTRLLLPYQNSQCLKWLYEKHITKVLNVENFKEEKKYYRLLEDLCACESEGCSEFMKKNVQTIKTLLLNSLSKAAITSRGPRIRCLIHLLNHDSSKKTILEYIPEAVLCCKDLNKRCRNSAFELICKMADKILEHGDANFAAFIDAITAGLICSPNMIAATILALACLIHYSKEHLHKEQLEAIMQNICLLATSTTREIVGPALGFIKMFMTVYEPNYVSTQLEVIVRTLSSVKDDCKRRFRQKMRDIYDRLVRKFGASTIISFVPTHDATTMTRLKALKKLNDRKKKRKEKEKQKQADSKDDSDDDDYMFSAKSKPKTMEEILAECDDDDDELDDDSDEPKDKRNKKKSKKHDVYLQEDEDDIVDFTSSSANRKITTIHPEEKQKMGDKIKKKQTEFKTAPDGRLIIAEEKPEKLPSTNKIPLEDDDDSDAGDADNENNLSSMLNDIVISRKRKMSSRSSETSEPANKYQAGGSGIHRKTNKNPIDKHTGSEYKSKKAKGDVKKKGMPDPFAYIPLSRNSLNRRKKKKSAGQFKSLVRSAKKGAAAGNKNFKSKNRNKK